MGFDQPSHWLVLVVVVAVLFGYKKLPEMSRSVGRSLRIFKTEMKGLGDDDATRDAAQPTTGATTVASTTPVAPVNAAAPVAPPVVVVAPVVTPAADPIAPGTTANGISTPVVDFSKSSSGE